MSMPVSGPGPYSKRTDKQPVRQVTGLPYGDNAALTQQQQSAPMSQTSSLPSPIPIHAPSTMPDQPVTAGADAGPGPGSEILTQRPATTAPGSKLVQALQNASASDATGSLASLLALAMERGL